MKSNAKKFKLKLKKAIKRFSFVDGLPTSSSHKHRALMGFSIYQDVKSKNQLNQLAIHLNRAGYKHDSMGNRNHSQEWDCYYSSRNGEPNMGISITPYAKCFLVINWKPSQDKQEKPYCVELI